MTLCYWNWPDKMLCLIMQAKLLSLALNTVNELVQKRHIQKMNLISIFDE